MPLATKDVTPTWAGFASVRRGTVLEADSRGVPARYTVLSGLQRDAFGKLYVYVDRSGVGPARLYARDLPADIEIVQA